MKNERIPKSYSAITDDSDHMPEFALIKKVWHGMTSVDIKGRLYTSFHGIPSK